MKMQGVLGMRFGFRLCCKFLVGGGESFFSMIQTYLSITKATLMKSDINHQVSRMLYFFI